MLLVTENTDADINAGNEEIEGLEQPKFGEERTDMIGKAASSFGGVYDIASACQKVYGFDEYIDWAQTINSGASIAFLKKFLNPKLIPSEKPLNGLLEPLKLKDAKVKLIVWSLGQTMSYYKGYCKSLRAANSSKKKISEAAKLEMFRAHVHSQKPDWQPEDFYRRAVLKSFYYPQEGSYRSRSGHKFEAMVRQGLYHLRTKHNWNISYTNKEKSVEVNGGNFGIDVLVDNGVNCLLLNLKTTSSSSSDYSYHYSRDIGPASLILSEELGNLDLTNAGIFAGLNWNPAAFSNSVTPYFLPDYFSIKKEKDRLAAIIHLLATCESMAIFKPDDYNPDDYLPSKAPEKSK